jgi:hypothetical protein
MHKKAKKSAVVESLPLAMRPLDPCAASRKRVAWDAKAAANTIRAALDLEEDCLIEEVETAESKDEAIRRVQTVIEDAEAALICIRGPVDSVKTPLGSRELGTVLAALRYWQRVGMLANNAADELEIAADGGMLKPLCRSEIDSLALKLNIPKVTRKPKLPALNRLELLVLKEMATCAIDAAGGDFGLMDELQSKRFGMTQQELGGYVTALQRKRLVTVHEPHPVDHRMIQQYTLSPEAWVLSGNPEYKDR